jgi:hypothetical protein
MKGKVPTGLSTMGLDTNGTRPLMGPAIPLENPRVFAPQSCSKPTLTPKQLYNRSLSQPFCLPWAEHPALAAPGALPYGSPLLWHTHRAWAARMLIEVIVGTHICSNANGYHCWIIFMQQWHWISSLPLIPLLYLLFSSLPDWRHRPGREEYICNFSVLQWVHLFHFFYFWCWMMYTNRSRCGIRVQTSDNYDVARVRRTHTWPTCHKASKETLANQSYII